MPTNRVVAISPQEVLEVKGHEQEDVDQTLEVMNAALLKNFDGKTLEVTVPRDLRCALLGAVASRYRDQGWGVKVCYDERKLIFWLDKRTKISLESKPEEGLPEANIDIATYDEEEALERTFEFHKKGDEVIDAG